MIRPDNYVIEQATHQLTELMGCSQVGGFGIVIRAEVSRDKKSDTTI